MKYISNNYVILLFLTVTVLFLFYYTAARCHRHHHSKKPRKAVAVFTGPKVHGTVLFSEEKGRNIRMDIHLQGLPPNSLHGFHVHEAGDLTDGCASACQHFNPHHKLHGCPGMTERHVGDLGNLMTDQHGVADYSTTDRMIRLRGKNNIIGRCLILHENRDDCGLGGNEESTKTGNAGKRIACAVIGYSKLNFEP